MGVMLFLLSFLWSGFVIAEPETFEKEAPKEPYATGFKLQSGWSKKVTFRSAIPSLAATPRHWDWRDQGGLTPIRNQGSVGTCWAFSTVATLADNLLLRKKVTVDLSEQYLVNCNKEGWGLNGGFFAHDYHKVSPMGAVLESDAPYTQKVGTCGNYNKPYHLVSWAYIPSANENTPPSTEEIKAAVYQYGPISVGIAATSALQSYKTGVFNQCDSTEPNHAVNIIGWDDDGQYWIVRNSWGTSFGESGFFKIKYGCNKIGIAANYIVLDDAPTPDPTPTPGPNPTPNPTPTPTPPPGPTPTPNPPPVPKCQPQPYANAGPNQRARYGQVVRVGSPPRPSTYYHWEINGIGNPQLYQSFAWVRPFRSSVLTQYATTKCGTARSNVVITLVR